jgi:low temperature requirement protein LtrA
VGRRQIAKAPVQASHLVERFGLFTLIVLGESVVRVAQAAAHVQDWTAATLAAAGGGFLIVAGLWWLYFDRLDEGVVRSVLRGLVWNYTHLPLLAGLVVIGSASSTRPWTPPAAGWNGRRPRPWAAGRRCTCSRPW